MKAVIGGKEVDVWHNSKTGKSIPYRKREDGEPSVVHTACMLSFCPEGWEELTARGIFLPLEGDEDLCAFCRKPVNQSGRDWLFIGDVRRCVPSDIPLSVILGRLPGREAAPTPNYWKEWSEWRNRVPRRPTLAEMVADLPNFAGPELAAIKERRAAEDIGVTATECAGWFTPEESLQRSIASVTAAIQGPLGHYRSIGTNTKP